MAYERHGDCAIHAIDFGNILFIYLVLNHNFATFNALISRAWLKNLPEIVF